MRLWKLGACVLALLVVACGGETGTVEQQTEGTLRLPLTSSAPDGKAYKLVGATFNITGTQTVTVTDTSADTVLTPLIAGSYTIELAGSWRMERADAPGVAVPAQLLSPNPLPFFVTKGETTEVRFQFKLAGEGTADVGIKVDNGGWVAGTIQFTGRDDSGSSPSDLDELIGKSVPFLISFESYTAMKDSWDKRVYVSTNATTVQFGGPPSALLQRVITSMKDGALFFTMRANPDGTIQYENLLLRAPGIVYELVLYSPPTPMPGAVDDTGYPIFRAFEFETYAVLYNSPSGTGVHGNADVNGSP